MSHNFIQEVEQYCLPGLSMSLAELKAIRKSVVESNNVILQLQFGFPMADIQTEMEAGLQALIQQHLPAGKLQLTITVDIKAHVVQEGVKAIPHIKNIIAVASGKGGVGKSTTAVNLALALVQAGARVGILDADIYGPNLPHMLGTDEIPARKDEKFCPVERYGMPSMSIGYLVDKTTPMVWRGPMVTRALQQLLFDTAWPELDYLIVDMPPGTGDIQLTLAQKVPVSGAVMVTTPQDMALLDVRKGLEMFRKVQVNVLGVIENMSQFVCPQCGACSPIFGAGGGAQLASACEVPLLGQIPLEMAVHQAIDAGKPTVAAAPDSQTAVLYRAVARRMVARLAQQKINYAAKFPSIVVTPK